MTKLTLSSQSQERIERLIDQLLRLALEPSCNVNAPTKSFSIRLTGSDSASPRLVVKTELRFLVDLVFDNSPKARTRKDCNCQKEQIRHDLRLLEKLDRLVDNRTKTQGSSIWNFTLKLWSTDLTQNLASFRLEWDRHKLQGKQRSLSNYRPQELVPPPADTLPPSPHHQDWGNAPDLPNFYGRTQELTQLEQWIETDRCRLVAIVGMAGSGKTQLSVKLGKGGIGKTDLSVKLARGLQNHFDYVIWRSLFNAPPFPNICGDLIKFLSNQQEVDIPTHSATQIASVLRWLQQHRCLIVLDNLESILQGGKHSGDYRPGYEAYGDFLQQIAEVPHQSCLLLTSREKPGNLMKLAGRNLPARFLDLGGLTAQDGQAIFNDISQFAATVEDWQTLNDLYNGNPLALKLTAQHIQYAYGGNISQFLQDSRPLFADLRELLNWHLERLADAEVEVLYWLAINREPVTLAELRADLVSSTAKAHVAETVRSLQRRLPIETTDIGFTLQPMLMEHVTERLIEQMCHEIISGDIRAFHRHALLKATAKDYIRESQGRVILQPIQDWVLETLGDPQQLKPQLNSLLAKVRSLPTKNGYATGNLINLLRHAEIDLNGYDFSGLFIQQAYLHKATLHEGNLSHATVTKTVFTQNYAHIFTVACSPDGTLLAAGDIRGNVHLWDLIQDKPLFTLSGHTNWICSLAFSPDSQQLVSSGFDHAIKLWSIRRGKCLKTLTGHDTGSWSVQFNPGGQQLASAGLDGIVRLWDLATGECVKTFTGHQHALYSLAVHPTKTVLASSSQDATIKLWNLETGHCFKTLQAHQDGVRSVVFSPCGQYLVSGGVDNTVRLWSAETGEQLHVFHGHTGEVYGVDFSADGKTIASCSDDRSVRLWDVETSDCINSLLHLAFMLVSIAFSPDGLTLASANGNQGVRIWETQTGRCLRTLAGDAHAICGLTFILRGPKDADAGVEDTSTSVSQQKLQLVSAGYADTLTLWDVETNCSCNFQEQTHTIQTVAASPDHQFLATSSRDQTVSLWDTKNLQRLKQFVGHTDGVWDVSFSPDSKRLASGSFDQTIKIWCPTTGMCLRTLRGHDAGVWSITWHPREDLLVSSSIDQTIRLWKVSTGQCVDVLSGHQSGVRSIAMSPDGTLLASGSLDGTLKLWDLPSRQCVDTLVGHTNFVWFVAFHPNGKTIASGGYDQTIRIWDAQTGECLHILQDQTGNVEVLAFSPDGKFLASSGDDGVIWLWNASTGELHKTLSAAKPYEGMRITNIQGLTHAQKASLRALGAV